MAGDGLLRTAIKMSRKLETAGIQAKVRIDPIGTNKNSRMIAIVTRNPLAAYKALTGKDIQLERDSGIDYNGGQDPKRFMTTIARTEVYLLTPAEDKAR
jgi:hypothetical protein